ncbi:hypothetical protein [Protaetiibacter intestinalis]|uniref:LPXTG cell wall anchor domain-containing protein n=1 Tax=Protaetiibacter intestinalis TaxID=2419774 RepID=A0A387B985_9MICO|nr:hypothetical protein [Protaetiibacter intestinalis]AYF97656.1 hypothetical protein D7I47_04870 [Protaetiibacter intestinalis]
MRLRPSLALAVGGAAVLTLVVAQPAFAATRTWTQAGDSWWSTATWTGGVPIAGDDVTFDGGPRSTYDLGDLGFGWFLFPTTHEVANGGGAITLSGGIEVSGGSTARIEPQLTSVGSQAWFVESGSTLQLPSAVGSDPSTFLRLTVDGTMTVEAAGNLDAGGTGCIEKQGTGVLQLLGGGGGVGTCAGQPRGLLVAAGELAVVGTPNLGGKDFAVTGGTFTGGTASGAAVVHELNLVGTGVVSPGPSSGAGIGMVELWGTSTWTGGTFQVDWDAPTNDSDYVYGSGQAITVGATRLDVRLAGTPTPGQFVRILGSDVSFTGQFAAPDGTALADGDEFTSNGQVYSVEYIAEGGASGVLLHWLRAAPVVVPPAEPAPSETLADSGAPQLWPLGAVAVALGAAGAALVGYRRRTRRTS